MNLNQPNDFMDPFLKGFFLSKRYHQTNLLEFIAKKLEQKLIIKKTKI